METLHQYAARLAKEFENADFEAEVNNCLVPPMSAQKFFEIATPEQAKAHMAAKGGAA